MATANHHKLTNVEAQRIMAILMETHQKIELLSHVPPLRKVPEFESFRQEVGPEVAQVLEEQVLLERQYKWVSTPQHEQSDVGFDSDQALPDFETLDDELRHSTRVVCRMLREAPAISSQLQAMDDEGPSAEMRKFLATFLELKSQTLTKLSTSVEEEKSKEDWFLEISAREEKASQTLRQLQKEIKAEKAEREREVSARNETIRKLREELEHIKASTLAEERQLEAETKASEVRAHGPHAPHTLHERIAWVRARTSSRAQHTTSHTPHDGAMMAPHAPGTACVQEADKTAFTTKESALSDELRRLREELKNKKQQNKEQEEALRKKKVKFEGECATWIGQYDTDMEEKDREISALRLIYEEERKELSRLETYFSKLMAEREAALAEERKKAEERARQQAQMATLSKAATMLQKMWRGKCARRDLDKKKSGKGGKGKKKKATKKASKRLCMICA